MSVGFMSVLFCDFCFLFVFYFLFISSWSLFASFCVSLFLTCSLVRSRNIELINKTNETDCVRNWNFNKFKMKSENKNWIEHWMTFQIRGKKAHEDNSFGIRFEYVAWAMCVHTMLACVSSDWFGLVCFCLFSSSIWSFWHVAQWIKPQVNSFTANWLFCAC